ncbi:PREDICTED: uncharacterized protein LOC107192164 [Dufourea novaeangliae]|uniref:uncharacterized protein LOC107192164 n=1 Tax=Dufourea novaeangliae TaxID=178035 RepID=UPI00076786A2|nr:PREDICTED: uncharacterized protein LOC107192164 [Dufourea novaeangliae]KZC15107.1 hypothetical protein WN55_06603 [Dufourea novaeangliae]
MIERNEDNTDNDNNLDRRKLIADKRTFLEKQFLEVQKEIKVSFAHLAQTLYAREKQLLRQSEALYRQQISLALSNPEILPPCITILDDRNTIEEQIRQFGRIELTGSNSTAITNLEPYKIEEYQDMNKDHVSFDKSIKSSESIFGNAKMEVSSSIEDRKVENVSRGLKTVSITDLTETAGRIFDYQRENSKENLNESLKINTECRNNDLNLQSANIEQDDAKSFRNCGRNIIEEQQDSYGLPEQVQQWLDQIVLETEIEPTIHEVEKLPEISDVYVCTKFQLET